MARRYSRISAASACRVASVAGVELGDDLHPALSLLFLTLPPAFGPLLRSLLSSHLHEIP